MMPLYYMLLRCESVQVTVIGGGALCRGEAVRGVEDVGKLC